MTLWHILRIYFSSNQSMWHRDTDNLLKLFSTAGPVSLLKTFYNSHILQQFVPELSIKPSQDHPSYPLDQLGLDQLPIICSSPFFFYIRHTTNTRSSHVHISSYLQYERTRQYCPHHHQSTSTLEMFSNENYVDRLQDTELKKKNHKP